MMDWSNLQNITDRLNLFIMKHIQRWWLQRKESSKLKKIVNKKNLC